MLKIHKCFHRSTHYEWEILGDDYWSFDDDDDIPLFKTCSSSPKSQKGKLLHSERKEGLSKASRRLKDLFGLFQFHALKKRKSRNGAVNHRQLQRILDEDFSHWSIQSESLDDDEWKPFTDDDFFPEIHSHAAQFDAHEDDIVCSFSMCSI